MENSLIARFNSLLRRKNTTKRHNQSDMSDIRIQIFGVDKSAEITVNWSRRFGSVSG